MAGWAVDAAFLAAERGGASGRLASLPVQVPRRCRRGLLVCPLPRWRVTARPGVARAGLARGGRTKRPEGDRAAHGDESFRFQHAE